MPTEFLHGLYDGGAGSGLADYWDVMRQSKVSGGGFLWAFLDEAVKRVDLDGRLDTNGNYAPDGIVGPYREKEGSYNAIKEVWSPLVIPERPAGGLPRDAARSRTATTSPTPVSAGSPGSCAGSAARASPGAGFPLWQRDRSAHGLRSRRGRLGHWPAPAEELAAGRRAVRARRRPAGA